MKIVGSSALDSYRGGVWRFYAKRISVFILLFFSANVFAQHAKLSSEDAADIYDNNWGWGDHTTLKPFVDVNVNGKTFKVLDSTLVDRASGNGQTTEYYTTHKLKYPRASFENYYKNPFDTSTVVLKKIDEPKAAFLIRPIYDLGVGYDVISKRLLRTTIGGVVLDADYKQKIGIELRVAAGNLTLPNYSDSAARFSGIVPGWGDRAYSNGNGNYSFQHISGNIIWRPSKIFNLQVGRDKHFWGDGYRSLFLSDVGAAIPYIKATTTIWRLQYTSMFMWMQDWTNSTGSAKDFRSKFGTFHYISFNASKWLNIGVFEAVIFQGTDKNRARGFDPNYLNPIVFFRPVEYSLGSSDNVMLGFAFKFRLNSKNQIYTQIILDEFYLKEIEHWSQGWWGNKQGIQIGYKCFDIGKIKNLNFQTEINIVRPYTYTHGSTQQNYANTGMPLAHPLGANFAESVVLVNYSWKQFSVQGKIIAAKYGLDSAGMDFGQNIFKSYSLRSSTDKLHPNAKDYGHHLYDGTATNLFYMELKGSYLFQTKFPLRAEFLTGIRSEHSLAIGTKTSFYFQIGFSLPLWRSYRDY